MSVFRINCRVCNNETTQPIKKLRLTPDSFGFDCPTCQQTYWRPCEDGWRASLLLRGARPILHLANVLAFVTLAQDTDLLAEVAEQEVKA